MASAVGQQRPPKWPRDPHALRRPAPGLRPLASAAFGHGDRLGILRVQGALVIHVSCTRVPNNYNKPILHYSYLKKEVHELTSNTAVLERTPCTKSLNLVPQPGIILRIHIYTPSKAGKNLDPGHPFLETLDAGASSRKIRSFDSWWICP